MKMYGLVRNQNDIEIYHAKQNGNTPSRNFAKAKAGWEKSSPSPCAAHCYY